MTEDGDTRFLQNLGELYEPVASHFEDSSHE
jgi:hypothetical protein